MKKLKVIYEPRGKAKEYAELAASLFKTCYHGCVYCYAPHVLRIRPDEFFAPAKARKNIISKLKSDAEYLKSIGERREILLCFTSDLYQSESKECRDTTRTALSTLLEAGLNVTILTKGGERSLADFDLFESHKDQFRYGVTLTFASDKDCLRYEPHADVTSNRIMALKTFHEKGIRTWVSIEPAWSAMDTLEIIDRTHEFVDVYKIGKMNYHPHSLAVDWPQYAKTVIIRLKELGKDYYLKEDLREELKPYREELKLYNIEV